MGDWWLIRDAVHSGPFNMGVDEALLQAAERDAAATLRFYSWQGPWLSLGHAQRVSPERLDACRRAGVGVVRRVTGGRAVLHGNDLTYAIAAPATRLPLGLRACYEQIGEGLLAALRSIGLDAELVSETASRDSAGTGFDCFEIPASGEICVAGRKLAGNAQRRSRGAVLQHGSIRLSADDPGIARAAGQLAGAATSTREAGCEASADELRSALERSLARALGARFEAVELDPCLRARGRERERSHPSGAVNPPRIPLSGPQEALFGGR